MNTPVKTVALEEDGTLSGTLSEVDSEAFVPTLTHLVTHWAMCIPKPW